MPQISWFVFQLQHLLKTKLDFANSSAYFGETDQMCFNSGSMSDVLQSEAKLFYVLTEGINVAFMSQSLKVFLLNQFRLLTDRNKI